MEYGVGIRRRNTEAKYGGEIRNTEYGVGIRRRNTEYGVGFSGKHPNFVNETGYSLSHLE